MIWATVSSRSCFCWLYRASPSLAAKNIISLISVLTIWWCPCVSTLMISYFIISIFCFLQSSFSFALAFAKYEKCATPFPPELLCLIYILFWGRKLRGFLMFFHLKRLNFQRLFSNRRHLLNGYVPLLILTFFSSVLQWKCNQNKTLQTIWSIYCTFLSFLCLWKHPCLRTRRER